MSLLEIWRDYWSPREEVDTSPRISDEVKYTTCYMCACRCGIKVHLKDGGIRYIEGNPRPSGQSRRDLRQGRRRHHAALFAGPADASRCCASASAAPASSRRSHGTRRSRRRCRWLATIRAERPEKARLLHRPRPEPVADRLLGDAVRHAELRRAWRLLLGQHGGRRHVHDRRQLLGIRRARLGAHPAVPDVRRRRGPRFQPDQARPCPG